jgi:hypothetical protein
MVICQATLNSPIFLDDDLVLQDVLVLRPEHFPVEGHQALSIAVILERSSSIGQATDILV